ncbi:hypothetical protein DFH09DRAFT_1380817 [Mycena vulgaris]|nr:hypothetical protein DFH09DRAFT_1380817 [Mycena vulgaris]
MHKTKPKKPPACDPCKIRRVLCHPQPNGAPCPRCAEKNTVCTTTAVPRGRPRKNPIPTSGDSPGSEVAMQQIVPQPSSPSTILQSPSVEESTTECPELTPEFVAHCFECFDRLSQVMNPIVNATSIRMTIRAVSYQLYLLPPPSRVLALCIIASSSYISSHEVILGEGPRPESLSDIAFFSSRRDVLGCGVRRSRALRALHAEALKAAWDCGIMLQVSTENAASCLLLDLLEEANVYGVSRPWGSAYISHLRALAPAWRTSTAVPPHGLPWSAYLMGDALRAMSSRKSVLFTRDEQLLITGPEPPSAEAMLSSLEKGTRTPGSALVFQSMGPYSFHTTCLARKLWETISGDLARLSPVSETAVLEFLASLSLIHAILSRLLEHADTALLSSPPPNDTPILIDNDEGLLRRCMTGLGLSFASLALALHCELDRRHRISTENVSAHTLERLRLLRHQAREMAALGARELARGIRYLPALHLPQMHYHTLRSYAQFALNQAEAAPVLSHDQVRDLETHSIAGELTLAGYSLDLVSSPENASLVERLARYIGNPSLPPQIFDAGDMLPDMFSPEQAWFNPTAELGSWIG